MVQTTSQKVLHPQETNGTSVVTSLGAKMVVSKLLPQQMATEAILAKATTTTLFVATTA